MKVRVKDSSYWLWCPACDDPERPTFTPSIVGAVVEVVPDKAGQCVDLPAEEAK